MSIDNKVLAIVNEVAILENITPKEALNKVIDYIAIESLAGTKASVGLKTDTLYYLDSVIDIDELKESKMDFLGNCYRKIYKNEKTLKEFVNYDKIVSDIVSNDFPSPVYIDDIGTGFEAVELFNKVNNGFLIYGVSRNITAYRIAVLNAHLFDMPLFVMYLDERVKISNIDLRLTSRNWEHANRWTPIKANLLDTI